MGTSFCLTYGFSSKQTSSSINWTVEYWYAQSSNFSHLLWICKLLSFFQRKGAASTLWIYWFVSSKPDVNSFTQSSNRTSESHFLIFPCWLPHCMTLLHFQWENEQWKSYSVQYEDLFRQSFPHFFSTLFISCNGLFYYYQHHFITQL